MMTLEERGFLQMLRLRGRSLKSLASGASFTGTINRIGAFMLSDPLGQDPRGKRVMEISKRCAPKITSQDKITDTASSEIFRVTQIDLDSPEYSLKYELEQLVPGLDQ